ncbi:MAG: hypothetical protein MUE73_08295 [Planctomycetes bacterium]|jgi:hypothetical protein|nr:hypothetical protein [Planctomycetota bacterium]
MDWLVEAASRGVSQLLGRASGPLHLRLFIMPSVVTFLAIRAGLRDARAGSPAFLWALLARPTERRRLFRSLLKDIGRVFIMAIVLDTTYQIVFLRWFYPVQVLIVAVACAIVPYVVIRGPVTRLARLRHRNTVRAPCGTGGGTVSSAEDAEGG